jgi:hypothetical protein
MWIVSQFDAATWDMLGWLVMVSGKVALGLVVVAGFLAINTIHFKREWRDRNQQDGWQPLKKFRVREWDKDAPYLVALWFSIVGYPGEIDRNRIQSPAYYIRNGKLIELQPAGGWERQHAYNLAVERTNIVRATFTGDDARRHWFGRDAQQGRLPAASLRSPEPRAALPPPPDENEVEGEFTPAPVPFAEALQGNTPTTIALGYTANGPWRWDVESAPHIRVHGGTQHSGKTNLIKTVAASVIPQGGHVILLDRRGFKDWTDYKRHVEFIDNRKEGAFVGTMQQLVEIDQERDELLGQAGASNLGELPNAPARLFVVVSEFGSACRRAVETGEMDEALPLLKSIMSEAGATGIHMIFEDQAINRNWPPECRGNAQPITGHLPMDSAEAGGYRQAHQLRRYEFHMDGERFQTWNMKAEAPLLLPTLPADDRVAIDVRSLVRSVQDNNSTQPKGPEITFTPTERTPNAPSSTDLQRMVWAWRDANPDGTQAELRREFEQKGIVIARSWAHECWHKWPGVKSQPATAAEYLAAMGITDAKMPGSGERVNLNLYNGAD